MLNSSWDAVVREKEAITVFGLCQRPRTHFLLFFQFFPMQAQFFKFQLCFASSLLRRAGAALSRWWFGSRLQITVSGGGGERCSATSVRFLWTICKGIVKGVALQLPLRYCKVLWPYCDSHWRQPRSLRLLGSRVFLSEDPVDLSECVRKFCTLSWFLFLNSIIICSNVKDLPSFLGFGRKFPS